MSAQPGPAWLSELIGLPGGDEVAELAVLFGPVWLSRPAELVGLPGIAGLEVLAGLESLAGMETLAWFVGRMS